MKEVIKKYIPGAKFIWRKIYWAYRKNIHSKRTKNVFSDKYKRNQWGSSESLSGKGSELTQTHTLLLLLPNLFQKYDVKTVLDIPCGDLNWMRFLDYRLDRYIGADIVDDLIKANNRKYADFGDFIILNLLKDKLPSVDLIICRDCLVHFSYGDIWKALTNIKRSGAKYLLTTTFINHGSNMDILTGAWRPLNLQAAPFDLGNPIEIIVEGSMESGGAYSDKSLGLWEIRDLAL